jgi:hypothetical protein
VICANRFGEKSFLMSAADRAAQLADRHNRVVRSRRFSVTLKKNRRAVALTLTVGTVVPIDANHN